VKAAARKKDYDEAVDGLCYLIRKQDSSLPLFDQTTGTAGPTPDAAAPLNPDAWKMAPVSTLSTYGVQPRFVKALEDGGILTVGDLAKAKADAGDRIFMWPTGIGEKGATQIDDACMSFFEARTAKLEEPVAMAETVEPKVEEVADAPAN
jgi:hypothetical protein